MRRWKERNRDHVNAYTRAWYRKNIEERRRKRREYLKKNPEMARANQLLVKYGIRLSEWKELLTIQRGQCKICFTRFSKKIKPCVDHDHSTNKVRGILCVNCNVMLGNARDSILILKQAIEYLASNSRQPKTKK